MNWKNATLGLFVFIVSFSACNKATLPKQKEIVIKNYDTYETYWKAIDKMEQKGLGNSIVNKVDSILLKALEEENTAQFLKL